ncbi:hypothetical protein [Heyndrickxia coagulans]|uniref:hypothetical protein n=1 Tax=Heyndrickxia coagulans TaxID=1398 RepID=UPI0014597303|nr:hypothetical protein [Heyndrickxia coagulans]NMH83262.1 hypothetical protein [Heyndrickxia coagulans]
MSQMSKFFNQFKRETLLSINTLAPAKVLEYNASTKRADLQPLFLLADSDGNTYKQSKIENAPVLNHCQGDVRAGALVFYICAQRSLANLNGTNYVNPDSSTLFSDNDAVVVGVFDG